MKTLDDKFLVSALNSSVFRISPDEFPGAQHYQEYFKHVSPIGLPSDRTDTTNQNLVFKTKVLSQYALPACTHNLTFSDAMVARAIEIIDSHPGQTINVLWSGGIDSTATLVAFLKLGKVSNVRVALTSYSIGEYRFFYETYIKGKIAIVSLDEIMAEVLTGKGNHIMVGSESGDALLGFDTIEQLIHFKGLAGLEKYYSPDAARNLISCYGMTDESTDYWTDLFVRSVDHSPRKIETMQDFAWWLLYNWRWQHASEKFLMRSKHLRKMFVGFYRGSTMESWAISRQQHLVQSINDIKRDYKEFIFDFTKDNVYYKEKMKLQSMSWLAGSNIADYMLNLADSDDNTYQLTGAEITANNPIPQLYNNDFNKSA